MATLDTDVQDPLKTILKGLYSRDTDYVIVSVDAISDMGSEAIPAIPYLASMLMDTRLGTVRVKNFSKKTPVSKVVARTLGNMGAIGIKSLSHALLDIKQSPGMADDLLRESVAEGLKQALDKNRDHDFACLKHTPELKALIETAKICLNLHDSPGRFDDNDPRRRLKYFKHFKPVAMKEGLETYLKVLGVVGDKRALALLQSIFPLARRDNQLDREPKGPFERAAITAQYRIDPLPLSTLHPSCLPVLIIDFTARGDLARVKRLLDEGVNPDTVTRTKRPLIELAYRKKHSEIMDLLNQHGAYIDLRLSKKDTLLMRASRDGDHEFVRVLLSYGADPSLKNRAGQTAMDAAMKELLTFWNEKADDKDAQPYFETISRLKDAGSPSPDETIIKKMDPRAKELLSL